MLRIKYLSNRFLAFSFILFVGLLVLGNIESFQNIIFNILDIRIKYQGQIRILILRLSYFLFFSSIITLIIMRFYEKLKVYDILKSIGLKSSVFISKIKIKYLFILIASYVMILVVSGVIFYDLGIDEVWYIHYAKNFSEYLIPFVTMNDQIVRLDLIAMLPYYILYYFYQLLFDTTLMGIKLLASIISTLSIGGIALVLRKKYNSTFIIMFIIFIVLQPVFGFVAISFFGEILSVMLLFLGAHFIFNNGKIVLGSLMLSLSIHTKFQLIYIIISALIAISVMTKDKAIMKALFITILLSFLIIILRGIPLFFNELVSVEKVLREFFGFATEYDSAPSWIIIIERLQLYNRAFPILLFAFIISSSIMILDNKFEKFIFAVFLITNLYWILFFDFVTYRHLFMGIIPACFLLTKVIIFIYSEIISRQVNKITMFKLFAFLSFIILFTYGASTNLIYAVVGYNDGVQFDLDGYQSRLFSKIEPDLKQQTFYGSLNKYINKEDIIFSDAPQIAEFYISNRIYTLDKINEYNDYFFDKFVIISREAHPNVLSEGKSKIIDQNIREIYSNKDYYLFKIIKQN